ncbi:MAG: hypothetical protein HQK60_10390, partial [Deltaproteobacteria bacterium]|nr:hypothetical protein [Deltaproteobacteria bacterium]
RQGDTTPPDVYSSAWDYGTAKIGYVTVVATQWGTSQTGMGSNITNTTGMVPDCLSGVSYFVNLSNGFAYSINAKGIQGFENIASPVKAQSFGRIVNNVWVPISFNWDGRSDTSQMYSSDDNNGANIDPWELYVTEGDGLGHIILDPTGSFPYPVLSIEGSQRWSTQGPLNTDTTLIVCFPAASINQLKGFRRDLNFIVYDSDENGISRKITGVSELATLAFGVGKDKIPVPGSATSGWFIATSATGASNRTPAQSLPFIAVVLITGQGVNYSTASPLFDRGPYVGPPAHYNAVVKVVDPTGVAN